MSDSCVYTGASRSVPIRLFLETLNLNHVFTEASEGGFQRGRTLLIIPFNRIVVEAKTELTHRLELLTWHSQPSSLQLPVCMSPAGRASDRYQALYVLSRLFQGWSVGWGKT